MDTDFLATPLSTYFIELDAGRFDRVMATLADSCVYIRPPLTADSSRASTLRTFRGKNAIRRFLDERGVLTLVHHIAASTRSGNDCMVQGTSTRSTATGVDQTLFMAHAVLDANDLITRFVALSAVLDLSPDPPPEP